MVIVKRKAHCVNHIGTQSPQLAAYIQWISLYLKSNLTLLKAQQSVQKWFQEKKLNVRARSAAGKRAVYIIHIKCVTCRPYYFYTVFEVWELTVYIITSGSHVLCDVYHGTGHV